MDQPEDVTRANTNRRGRFLGNAVGDALARATLGRRWEIPLESTPIVRRHMFHVLAVFFLKTACALEHCGSPHAHIEFPHQLVFNKCDCGGRPHDVFGQTKATPEIMACVAK